MAPVRLHNCVCIAAHELDWDFTQAVNAVKSVTGRMATKKEQATGLLLSVVSLDLRALVRHRSVLPGTSFVEPNESNAHSSLYRVFGAGAAKSAHDGLARKLQTAEAAVQ
jgi:hypothetical protein